MRKSQARRTRSDRLLAASQRTGGTRSGLPQGHVLLQRAAEEPQLPRPAEPAGVAALRRQTGNCRRIGSEIILDGMKERLEKFRSFRLFMDICVRCGACADKCHFYIGLGRSRRTCRCCGRN